MNRFSLRIAALALVAGLAAFVAPTKASAINLDIQVGPSAPPPPVVEHRWAPPYREAVWIGGHYEWRGGRYVWIGGYYAYPPHRGAHWVPAKYVFRHGTYFYRPGHWV
jgi:hypothetical protein